MRAGKILLSEKCLLDMLTFPGGRLGYVGWAEDYLKIVAVVEHPDMPEIKEGEELTIITPVVRTFDVLRLDPKPGIRTRLKLAWKMLTVRD